MKRSERKVATPIGDFHKRLLGPLLMAMGLWLLRPRADSGSLIKEGVPRFP